MKIHENYNLKYYNKIFNGRVFKDVELINKSNKTYIGLKYYLKIIQYPEDIYDNLVPEIDKALLGEFYEPIELSSEEIELGKENTVIKDHGYIGILPTKDFRAILIEYAEFLKTAPLIGTKV